MTNAALLSLGSERSAQLWDLGKADTTFTEMILNVKVKHTPSIGFF